MFKLQPINEVEVREPRPGGRVNEAYAEIIATAETMKPGQGFSVPYSEDKDKSVQKFRAHVRSALNAKRFDGKFKQLEVKIGRDEKSIAVRYPKPESAKAVK